MYGVPKPDYSTIRLDTAVTIQGPNNAVVFTLPPTYQLGDAFTVINDPTIDGGRVIFNKDGIYSVGASSADGGAANESLIKLSKPTGQAVNVVSGAAEYTFEYLTDSRTSVIGNASSVCQIFYAKAGWYIQFVQSDGGNTPSGFLAILCKIA